MEVIISKIAIMLVPALLAIILHEVAHGYMAERFGDPTARLLGRLTLNPFKHLDPIGSIAIFIFGFGWARPVPVNPGNFRRPRRDMIWVALAGPATNLSLAVFSALLLRGLSLIDQTSFGGWSSYTHFVAPVKMMAGFSLYINVLLGLFNLIPIPPLDGGRILTGILPERYASLIGKLEPFGFVLILLVVFFTDIWSLILGPVINTLVLFMAGDEFRMVEKAMHFLFSR
ncbi:Zn-dependent protease (includes SpoIVFB) [Desulfuromusa kysingii]|uniref:Zn-dependent protease (Includes SpoIVFB) n=1 Tax=Desulfuromusa kysingii TaxID=37625 RepID=A0A1H4CZE7_9BACT|nr:site-2 protease family protein [Desulfuromusa kysingii]SEA65698.1 Zn-dependent protease (includes SpoIVFB) [Desulfuromusa kysingii]